MPSRQNVKVNIAKKQDHILKLPVFSRAITECNNATPQSHGIRDTFSTLSQNQYPPQPNSLYAHQDPRPIPSVKKLQENESHGFINLIEFLLIFSFNSDIIAKENINEKPIYPV